MRFAEVAVDLLQRQRDRLFQLLQFLRQRQISWRACSRHCCDSISVSMCLLQLSFPLASNFELRNAVDANFGSNSAEVSSHAAISPAVTIAPLIACLELFLLLTRGRRVVLRPRSSAHRPLLLMSDQRGNDGLSCPRSCQSYGDARFAFNLYLNPGLLIALVLSHIPDWASLERLNNIADSFP